MAITNNGVNVSVPTAQVPSGYTITPVAIPTGDELYVNNTTIIVAKADIENANEATAFTALVADVNSQAAALAAVAFTTTETTTLVTNLINITVNQSDVTDTVQYSTVAESFACKVQMYVQVVEVT